MGRYVYCCFQCNKFKHTHLHRDDVGPRGVGHCHPVGQVHAAVTVGPEEGMRVGYCQRPGALPLLGGVLWRLHKGNWEVRGDRKELDEKGERN